ncbi:MAG: cellulase family glycosylhydrolase [Ruminococcus sp.]|nr:cellulase family glycosylhydrolase [Ruminococcus sp.]
MVKSKITRIISMISAAACMTACINFSSVVDISDAEAVEVKTAFEITEDMGLGWNLGNSFDAYDNRVDKMGLESETCWGNPKTTNEMLDTVKAKGFNTIRVPVTWYQHVDENYTIDAEWLARVKEVVDHCYNNDMYVILNLHHEEPYQNRSTLGADYEEISGFVTAIWKQLAETFKDYDQHLIFETMNEPRATGTDHEWWGPHDDEVDTINKINEDALNVIRKAGGNNDTRLVMMPSYCASSDVSMMSKTIISDDDFVAASVHAYSPYSFAMDADADHSVFTEANKNELINIMDGIRKTFSDKDIPVVLGEFSASDYNNTEARCEWAEVYLSTTKTYGFPCVIWDNNSIGGTNKAENHGYLNRSNCTWYENSEPVIDTMLKVLDDSTIVWGSARKSPVIEHDDISTGTQLIDKTYSLDAAVKDGNCTPGLNADWKLLENGDVAVKFTGEAPVIAVCDGAWDNWTEIKPYDDADGIAYYSSEHIKAAWSGDPADIAHLFVRTNSKTNVEAIAIIGGGTVVDPPEDDTKVYEIELANRGTSNILTFTIEGASGSTTNGCVGYMGADWTSLEWEGKIGADGKLNVEVDISSIPASISSAQIQIWWCDDKSAEMTTYNFKSENAQETTTAAVPVDNTTTTTIVITDKTLIGDANEDGSVDIADATAIVQHMGNPDEYALSKQGQINADIVNQGDGVTGADAVALQLIEAKKIKQSELPITMEHYNELLAE